MSKEGLGPVERGLVHDVTRRQETAAGIRCLSFHINCKSNCDTVTVTAEARVMPEKRSSPPPPTKKEKACTQASLTKVKLQNIKNLKHKARVVE